MQFFPIASSQDSQSLFAAAGDAQTKSSAELFADLLGQYMPQQTTSAATSLVQGAATSQATTAGALKMTEEDFAKVKDSLLQFGLTDRDVQELNTAVRSPEGLTWESFAQTVTEKIERQEEGATLTPLEQQHVYSFLQKLGFSPEKMQALANDIVAGRRSSVLSEIASAVAKMPADGKVSLGQQELATVMGLLRISATAQGRAQQLLAGKSGELSRQDMLSAVNILKEDMLRRQAAKTEGLNKLRDAIDSAWNDAKAETRRLGRADRRQDSTPQEMLLKAERAQDERERAEAERAWAKRQERAKGQEERAESKAARDVQEGKDGKVAQVRSEDGSAKTRAAKTAAKTAADHLAAGNRVETAQSAAEKQAQTGKDDASGWSDFLRKIKTETETATTKKSAATGFDSAVTAAAAAGLAQVQGQAASTAGLAENLASRQVLSQVRAGLFTALASGAQSLSLELTPDNLGKLNVMLQVNNKEVQAVIKADTPEAHRLLTEQAALIKDALEQQGFKVAKLDIQTSLAKNDYSGNFSGMEQFSQGRGEAEQSVFKSALTKLRRAGQTLAQGLHDNLQAATSSRRSGLDIIA